LYYNLNDANNHAKKYPPQITHSLPSSLEGEGKAPGVKSSGDFGNPF
jgi:hypothetical protein